MADAKHTPVQFGQTVGADFEANTMTLEMEPGYVVAVGPVAVVPRDTYDDLMQALKMLHDDIAEYARINNLGGFDNHWMRLARAALAKASA